jgi:hypothetical protein
MGACLDCGTSGVFLRTSKQGLCTTCKAAVERRYEAEKRRLQEAVLFAGALRDPQDQAPYLRQALGSLRALRACEAFGCGPMKLDLGATARSLSARLRVIGGAPKEAGADRPLLTPPTREGSGAAKGQLGSEGERRRARRKAETLPVRLGKGGLRALATDTSPGGLCVHAPVFESAGTRVRLILQLPRGLMATEGVVRWARRAGWRDQEEGPAVMGFELSPTPPERRSPAVGGAPPA